MHISSWCQSDFSHIAGSSCWPACTLLYAPPEVVLAAEARSHVAVHPSHDVWSMAVLAYEAITQSRALSTQSQVLRTAHGSAAYPWEQPLEQQPLAWRQSRLQPVVAPCLARDPAQRPSAADVHTAAAQLGQLTAHA